MGLAAAGYWLEGSVAEAVGLVLVGFALPYAAWNWFIAFMIFQQHTHPRIPWYSERDLPMPSYFEAQVKATPHVIFGAPFRWVMRHIMEHTAHHVDTKIPLYRLAGGQRELEAAFAGIVVECFSVKNLCRTLSVCHLYDYQNHRWLGFGLALVVAACEGTRDEQ